MRLRPWYIGLALGLSLTFHLGAGVIALTREETPQLAGGGVQIGADIGTAFDTVIQSGDPSDTIVAATQPDTLTPETPPVAQPVTEPVKPAEAPRPPVAAIEPAPQQPAAEPTPPAAAPVVLPEPLAADPTATLALSAAAPSAPPAQKPAEPVPAVAPALLAPVVPVEAVKPLPEPAKPEPAKPEPKKSDAPKSKKPAKPAAAMAPAAAAQTNAKTSAPAAPTQGGAGGQSNVTAHAGGAGRIGTGDAEGNSDVTNYPGQISRALRRALYYPPSAKRRRLTGETLVSFVVAKGGSASSIRVARSSGVPELDEAALETVRRAAPFPAIPPAARRDSWTFTIPIAFR